MVEIVVALAIFALVSTALMAVTASSLSLVRNNHNRAVAANLAQEEMELLRQSISASGIDSQQVGITTRSPNVGGVTYTVSRDIDWVSEGAAGSGCDSAGGADFMRITVTVRWPNMRAADPVTSSTAVNPGPGVYGRRTGHVGAKIVDRDGAAQPSQSISVSAPGVARSASTTSDGCAFFDHLQPGTYVVTAQTSGFVGRQGESAPTDSVGVVAAQKTSYRFEVDRPATLLLTVSGRMGGAVPDNVPLTVANNGLLPSGVKAVQGTGPSRTLGGLFPYRSGYQVWAGDCSDADPGAGGGQRPDAIASNPGATASATVQLASVDVHVTDSGGNPVAGASVQASPASPASCAAGPTLTYSDATTGPDGVVRITLPLGSWLVRRAGAYGDTATTVTATSAQSVTTMEVSG